MARFKYTAKDSNGKTQKGSVDADDRRAALAQIKAQGLQPVGIEETSSKGTTIVHGKIKVKTMALFCKQMATILKAGVSLSNALNIMKSQVEDKKFKIILGEVTTKIQQGSSMVEAFKPYQRSLPLLFLNMIEAGEMSGTLDQCLDRAAENFLASNRINSKVKGAMIYPMCLLVVTVAVFVGMMIFVLPMFEDVFSQFDSKLPAITTFMINLSYSMQHQWYLYLAAVAAIVVVFKLLTGNEAGKVAFDKLVLRLPVAGALMVKIITSRYTRTLSTLSASGLSMLIGLEMASKAVENRYVMSKIQEIIVAVKNGESLNRPLERAGVFPPMVIHMTRLGEESGSLDELLDQCAKFYDEESEAATSQLMSLMEPLIILVMGGMVLSIVAAIMLPLMGMATAIA